jgi:hypothetical protein
MGNEFIQQLLVKRSSLQGQLAAVNALLAAEGYADTEGLPAWKSASPVTKAETIRRVLVKANGKPLTTKELVDRMQQEGYVFNTTNPRNAMNNSLYGKKKLAFVTRDPSNAGFILAPGAAKAAPAAKPAQAAK